MATHTMQRQAGGEVGNPVVEGDLVAVHIPHQANNVLDVVGMTQEAMAHAAPGGIGHLGILHMEAGARKRAERTGMIVMQMRQHDLVDIFRRDAEGTNAIRRKPQQGPATLGGGRSEEHTSELKSLMRISYAVLCL